MTTRTELETPATVVEGPAYMVNTEDGPMAQIACFAGIEIGGKLYSLTAPAGRSYNDAYRFVAQINELGSVNLAKWVEVEPYDRELEAEIDWRDEVEDRRACGDYRFG